MSMRPEERAQAIIASERGSALVPSLPPEELLFTLRAASKEEAGELISHATLSQARFVLDVEIWKGEEVDPEKAGLWLEILDQGGTRRWERWLKGLDIADLAALLGRLVASSFADEDGMPERDDEEGETTFTLDGVHCFTVAAGQADRVRKLLTLLHTLDQRKFLHLAETLFSGFNAEDEEAAARFRRVRLAERGFPDFEEARRIYAPLTVEAFRALAGKGSAPAPVFASPRYPATLNPDGGLLRRLLGRLAGKAGGEGVMRELALLTNLTVAADAMALGEDSSFIAAARKVAGRLTIALELLHGRDEGAMEETLARSTLEHLFRVGNTRIEEGARAARSLVRAEWPKTVSALAAHLSEGEGAALTALTAKLPKAAVETPSGWEREDFSTLAQLQGAALSARKAVTAWRFLRDGLGVSEGELKRGEEGIPFTAAFATALASGALGRGFAFAPLEPVEVGPALGRFTPEARGPLIAQATAFAAGKISLGEEESGLLSSFFEEALRELEEEARALKGALPPDPRFVRSIVLKGR